MQNYNKLESGEKFLFKVPEIGFEEKIPYVFIPVKGGRIRIASLNLIGMIEWNRKFGLSIADKIRSQFPDLSGIVFLSAVEKSLQLAQVICEELSVSLMAVAYNRKKPHMGIDAENKRPFIQVGGSSITSGDTYLLLYERDVNLISTATRGVIIIDDVISTGGTIAALATLLDEVAERKGMSKESIQIKGIYCVAKEGESKPLYKGLSRRIHWLGLLPEPRFFPDSRLK